MSYGQFGYPQIQITFGGMSWTGGMAAGVSTIHAIDASFNGEEFLTFAQGTFSRVMQARTAGRLEDVRPVLSQNMWQTFSAAKGKVPVVATIEHATIYDAHRDASWDSVTVRIAAKTTARKKNDLVEDWTFQRPAVTGQQQLPPECPSCGAPLSLDENGACKYCRVAVGGARGGWKLVRALPPPAAPKVSTGFGRAWVAFWIIFMILMTVVLPIGIVVAVTKTTSDVTGGFGSFGSSGGASIVSQKGPEKVTSKTTTTKARGATTSTTSAPLPGTTTGSATFSGGITGNADGKIVLPGGASGPCGGRPAGTSGLVYSFSGVDDTEQQAISVTMNLPAGVRGPGDFDLATTPMSITASFAGQPTDGGASTAQTWTVGPGTTATFSLGAEASGSLTVNGLQPTAPFPAGDSLGQPLSVVVTFSCT